MRFHRFLVTANQLRVRLHLGLAELVLGLCGATVLVGALAIFGGAFKDHLSYFPHSGSVLPELAGDLAGYAASKGTLRFGDDKPLPKALVEKLIAVRRQQLQTPKASGPNGAER